MHRDDVRVEKPCFVAESELESGDLSEREPGQYCRVCKKHVYDLSAMTEDAAVALVELNRERGLCVSYWTDDAGHLEHQTVNPQPRRVAVQLIGASALLAGCATSTPATEQTATAAASLEATSAPPDVTTPAGVTARIDVTTPTNATAPLVGSVDVTAVASSSATSSATPAASTDATAAPAKTAVEACDKAPARPKKSLVPKKPRFHIRGVMLMSDAIDKW